MIQVDAKQIFSLKRVPKTHQVQSTTELERSQINMSEPNQTRGIRSMLNDPRFSDLTITCGDRTFPVHKVVVCSQSDFFMNACVGNFREASDNTIDLPDDRADIVEKMISFFYTSGYDDDGSSSITEPADEESERESEVAYEMALGGDLSAQDIAQILTEERELVARQLTNIRVYALADKYLVPNLKDLALKKFDGNRNDERWYAGLGTIVREGYTVTAAHDREMRDAAISLCLKHISDPFMPDDLNERVFGTVFSDIPEARIDILERALSILTESRNAYQRLNQDHEKVIATMREESARLRSEPFRTQDALACLKEKLGHDDACIQRNNRLGSISLDIYLSMAPGAANFKQFVRLECRTCQFPVRVLAEE